MIFRRISYVLAAQFTAFVFGLLLITGLVFLSADVAQRHGETRARLERQLLAIMNRPEGSGFVSALPPFQRERIRVTDALGKTLFAGTLYNDIPFSARRRIVTVERDRESYDILTAPVYDGGQVVAYIQVADRSLQDDLSARVFLFLVVSAGISILTFGVGLFFARRSLKPAENMMERLEQFTQDASHELRTPLTSISTSIDLALTSSDNAQELQSAKKGVKDVTILVERLLELARLDTFVLKKESVDLSDLLLTIIDTYADAMHQKRIELQRHIARGITVQGDPTLVRQIVSNLLSNAIKFNRSGGTITVTLTKNMLSVQDTGDGITAEAMPRIFDRFFREDAARTNMRDGLGLGLALTKRIVDLHGWTIAVESKKNTGTTFSVKF